MTPGLLAEEPADFSLVLGGPLYQLLRRSRLSDDALTLVHRRILAGVLITWLPLLLLSTWEGRAWWGDVEVPFLLNAEVHARFLLALPLLILAELTVHLRMRRLLAQFVARDLIPDAGPASRGRGDCDRPCVCGIRWPPSSCSSFSSTGSASHCADYVAVDASTWARAAAERLRIRQPLARRLVARAGQPADLPVPAGRWYFRMFIWTRFLWQLSRIELKLVPTHPDRVGGLGFLANVVYAFTPLLLAHGVLLAGLIADRIFFDGATLPQFTVEIIATSAPSCSWCSAR